MKLRLLILTTAFAGSLGGCASLTGIKAPSCDGGARRPLNPSLWDWDSATPMAIRPAEESVSDASPVTSGPRLKKAESKKASSGSAVAIAGNPRFDLASSLQPCVEAWRG